MNRTTRRVAEAGWALLFFPFQMIYRVIRQLVRWKCFPCGILSLFFL